MKLKKGLWTVRFGLRICRMNGTDCPRNIFGIDVPCDSMGCLQDSHWSGGALGDLPSYSLGSAYGAQFLHKMKQDIDIDKLVFQLGKQDRTKGTAWPTEKIHKYGMLLTPAQLIRECLRRGIQCRLLQSNISQKVVIKSMI